jgi:hypothetical protein
VVVNTRTLKQVRFFSNKSEIFRSSSCGSQGRHSCDLATWSVLAGGQVHGYVLWLLQVHPKFRSEGSEWVV